MSTPQEVYEKGQEYRGLCISDDESRHEVKVVYVGINSCGNHVVSNSRSQKRKFIGINYEQGNEPIFTFRLSSQIKY